MRGLEIQFFPLPILYFENVLLDYFHFQIQRYHMRFFSNF